MTKKINWTFIIIVLIIAAFLIGYGKTLIPLNKTDQNSICEGKTLQNKEITEIQLLGNATSSALLEVYSDYQCPACAHYYADTIKLLIEDYVDTGKIKLMYHDIAFEGARSQLAAEAAHCANDQGKFWEYHDKIMTMRYQTDNNNVYGKDSLEKIAKDMGLDECEFNICLESGKYTKTVKDDTQQALKIITGTPTTFLNGKMVSDDKGKNLGAMSYDVLKTKIEEALKSSSQP